MSGTVQRRSRRGHESIFYRDLRAAKLWVSSSSPSPWPHGFVGEDPPPPPILSLEECVECSPGDDNFRNPPKASLAPVSSTRQDEPTPSYNTQISSFQTPGTSNWQSPVFDRSWDGERERARAHDDVGQKQSRGLLLLPPPSPGKAVTPVIQSNAPADTHGWVTVYGFRPHDTNLVLREFEKCGTILKHVPGPSGANWVHILYENYNDAQKALQKNGMQISAALIVGVKPVDPLQHQSLTQKVNTGFMTLPLRSSGEVTKSALSVKASSRPYYLQQPNEGCQRLSGAMASPSKSIVSRLVDLIFGI